MQWIASIKEDTTVPSYESRIWQYVEHLRSNSDLKTAEYFRPVLGLIFLRFVEIQCRAFGFERERLLPSYPDPDIGRRIDGLMREIEEKISALRGVLPDYYYRISSWLLADLIRIFSEISSDSACTRLFEYFLFKFARIEAKSESEWFTPAAVAQLLAEIIEPRHGQLYDPACGSGGSFIASAHFVSARNVDPRVHLSMHGSERVDDIGRLARMNLAIHGLSGEIRHGGVVNSLYGGDNQQSIGKFDFVFADPPFNMKTLDRDHVYYDVFGDRRFPFGIPRTLNANYLWIQLCYSSLNRNGRAGIVMSAAACDARHSEREIRRKLVEARIVDAIIAVDSKMFASSRAPCTLWFLDRGKVHTPRSDKVLFLDARRIYRQVDRKHRDWSEAQIGFLGNIVRLYRGECPDSTVGGSAAEAQIEELFGEEAAYRDVAGLCKVVSTADISARDWSLNPNRFIEVDPGDTPSQGQFYSCFISYSSNDQQFAIRLRADLRGKRIECWVASEDLRIGDRFQERIEESIRFYDKVVIVLSEASVNSQWVEREVTPLSSERIARNELYCFQSR